jgi:hypothetical protein
MSIDARGGVGLEGTDVLDLMAWLRMALGAFLVAVGINNYPRVPRSNSASVAHVVYAEAIAHNLGSTVEDPTWIEIEDLSKSYISRLDDLDASDRFHSRLLSGAGSLIVVMGVIELFLLRSGRSRAVASTPLGER